jgi:hypothetical protein
MTVAERFRKSLESTFIRDGEVYRGVNKKEVIIYFEDDSKLVLTFHKNHLQYMEATEEKEVEEQ